MVVPPPPFCSYQWEVEQTSEDFVGPGNKLADNPTHLTPGKAMKPLRVWFRSAPCQQDFFFPRKKSSDPLHLSRFLCLQSFVNRGFSLYLLFQPLLCSSSRDRDSRSTKDEMGKCCICVEIRTSQIFII